MLHRIEGGGGLARFPVDCWGSLKRSMDPEVFGNPQRHAVGRIDFFEAFESEQ